ncbi:MAG: hypothetical protein ACHQNT_08685, partial [Bacteroidia bacterium]
YQPKSKLLKLKFMTIAEKQAKLKEMASEFISKVATKSDIDNKRIFLRGYVGPAYSYLDDKNEKSNENRIRVYLSPELNSYVEFDIEFVEHHLPIVPENGLGGRNIWLKATRVVDGKVEEIELTYGGCGYELSKTKHYLDGDMLAGAGDNAAQTPMGCGTTPTPTCPSRCPGTVNCATPTQTCPGSRCSQMTLGCAGGNGNPLPTGMLCGKYSTVVGCDEWDFRKNYSPY